MLKLNKIKTLLLGITFTLLFAQTAHAATYTVTKGDTLYSLGRLFNTRYTTIASTNKISGTSIYIGQTLTVPGTYHTVLRGETLYSISRKYNVAIDTIRKASSEWDNIIYPGQKLLIPNGVTSTTATSTTTTTAAATTRPAVIPYTAADLDLLARLVRAEAENQTYRAKVAVAAVVINRVQSSLFPNTLREVIYERSNGYYQFTPVVNGHINKVASQSDINAAKEALHGADPTNGALFYFDDSTTNTWLWSKKVALRDGNMVYSY
jgi:spore germination cell wall hydrolase CwlJ-like protein